MWGLCWEGYGKAWERACARSNFWGKLCELRDSLLICANCVLLVIIDWIYCIYRNSMPVYFIVRIICDFGLLCELCELIELCDSFVNYVIVWWYTKVYQFETDVWMVWKVWIIILFLAVPFLGHPTRTLELYIQCIYIAHNLRIVCTIATIQSFIQIAHTIITGIYRVILKL